MLKNLTHFAPIISNGNCRYLIVFLTKIIFSITFLTTLSMSQVIRNNGTYIATYDKVYIHIDSLNIINDLNGHITIQQQSEVRVNAFVTNTLGTITIQTNSFIYVMKDINNLNNIKINETGSMKTFKNVFNGGVVTNDGVIEIGE